MGTNKKTTDLSPMTSYQPQPSAFEEFLNEKNITQLVLTSSLIALTAPALAGAGLGLRDSAAGIAAAAEIKIEFTSVMAVLCFLTSPIIYMMLIFFVFSNMTITEFPDALKKFASCAITGIVVFILRRQSALWQEMFSSQKS